MCQQCPNQCSKCSNAMTCSSCVSSAFFLVNNFCVTCYSLIINCLTCEIQQEGSSGNDNYGVSCIKCL